MHALIIEQDARLIRMIADVLVEHGFRSFDVAGSGEEALKMAQAHCPDLITSDVRLGTCNGLSTVREICCGRAIPVVFVTATAWEVRAHSADLPVVQKPFARSDLNSAVAKAVSCAPPTSW